MSTNLNPSDTQTRSQTTLRADFTIFANMLRPGARVLDLGCGDGALLKFLNSTRGVKGYGIEIDDANVLAALTNGINVIQSDLERGLNSFGDATFDTVLLSQTLQAMRNIEGLMREMARVGREVIVSFPNLRYQPNFEQLEAGRMPVSDVLPHQWHNTPNIHLCTLFDFEDLCAQLQLSIVERVALAQGRPVTDNPNVNSELAIYRVKRG
jgi:methionine biosynthesis protein MetW